MRRVTVTLPDDVVDEIDRRDANRSKFVLEAARRELERRRREELARSLENPHTDTGRVAEMGLEEWGRAVTPADQDLLDPAAGRRIRWTPGEGWVETSE